MTAQILRIKQSASASALPMNVANTQHMQGQQVRAPNDHAHCEDIALAQEYCRQHHDANYLYDRQM